MKGKILYQFYEEGTLHSTLLLTDDQAAVFKFIESLGYNISLEKADDFPPYEIDPKEWLKGS